MNTQPLKKHQYPEWVYLFILALVGSIFYSLSISPKYLYAAQYFHKAEVLMEKKDYQNAIVLLNKAKNYTPFSKAIKITLARCYLTIGGTKNIQLAIDELWDLPIPESTWRELKTMFPRDYQSRFKE